MLVMSPYADEDGSLGQALAASVGSVLINPRHANAVPRSAGIDNHRGARAMVQHLAGVGHRSIAFIAGPDDNFDAGERLRGYREAMAEFLPGAEPLVLPGDFSEASGQRAGRALLEAPAMPHAVFAANDMMALGCMYALVQAGHRVPQKIAVAGFDDIPLARYVHPSLTTMRVDMARLGADAMRLLLRDPGDAQPQHLLRAPQLIVRESCGGARASPDSS
jgi:LacI family transcriptional regulator